MKAAQPFLGAVLLIAVLFFDIPAVFLLLAGALLVVPVRRSRQKVRPIWKVKVSSATTNQTDFYGGSQIRPVEGKQAVAIIRGQERHPVGVINVAAADFDAQLEKLIKVAEERASTLNAYGDGLL